MVLSAEGLEQNQKPPSLLTGRRGTLFLHYELQEDLGQGAFGRAVRARRRRDGLPVVVKIMHPDTLSDSAREEVRAARDPLLSKRAPLT